MAMPAGPNATAKGMVTDTAAVVASVRNRYTCAVLDAKKAERDQQLGPGYEQTEY
jgi:hypothetical protein